MKNTIRQVRNQIVTAAAQLQTDAEHIERITAPGRAFECLLDAVLAHQSDAKLDTGEDVADRWE